MLDFAPDQDITGGSIDNWFVDDQISDDRTLIYPLVIVPRLEANVYEVSSANETSSEGFATLEEKKCNQRLELLAKSYVESEQSDYWRDLQARLSILENEIEALIPRYTESDWELLEQFKNSIDRINEG